MNKQFTKNDLQIGHMVKFRNGDLSMLMGDLFKDTGGALALRHYDNFLFHTSNSNYDIVEIYDFKEDADIKDIIYTVYRQTYFLDSFIDKGYVELIWKREKEIDWNKVPEFTRVLVRDNEEDKWKKGYFLYYSKTLTHPYVITCHGKFTYEEGYYCGGYKQIKIYDENDIKEEWYE